jgi:LAO/AO transport system kinase
MRKLLEATPERRNQSIRIGICGAPGAGKSSLIEKLGLYITQEADKKLAVLAIDPSSERTGGSILGDKTRMEFLSVEPNAYVRPSPTRGVLGGVALNTSEVQMLCEHAGADCVITETVGVGQSEIEINYLADFVVFVVPPGSGDGLQGSKKGVMEIADMICVNKFDGEYKSVC